MINEIEKINKEAIKKANSYYKRIHTKEEEDHFNKGFDIWQKPIYKLLKKCQK